ncbi:hypothetical protein Tsubulata_032392 [Turnera subulata]|uniref:RING-type domain-containing protein n=1 Tax=Turnera subulata TaxID=218843 RepID=A0A9Q0J1E2_9ROSI|nr:hypothetical protein Tsubulata_032392 [Turnera subulata]
MTLLLLYCCLSCRNLNNDNPEPDIEQGNPQQQPKQKGLMVTSISGVIMVYKSGEDHVNRSDCVICLEEFKDGDQCRVLFHCKHIYHQACIDTWLVKDRHCPLCRDSVRGTANSNDQDCRDSGRGTANSNDQERA